MAKANILIVEDEQALAKALKLRFEENGYSVNVAFNGEEALNLIANQNFDLIALDILMPKVDGWDLLEKLQGHYRKIIVLSNLGQEEDKKRARDLGADEFLVKSDTSLSEVIMSAEKLLNM